MGLKTDRMERVMLTIVFGGGARSRGWCEDLQSR